MVELLGEVDANAITSRVPKPKPVKSETRRKVRILSPPLSQELSPKKASEQKLALSVKEEDLKSDITFGDDLLPAGDYGDSPMSDPLPSSPVVKAVERKNTIALKKEEDEEDDMDDDELIAIAEATGHTQANASRVNMAGKRPPPQPKLKDPTYPSPVTSSPIRINPETVDASAWTAVTKKLNVLSSPATDTHMFGKLRAQDAVEEDGSLRFFWLDYSEVNGTLCLFGKVKDKKTGRFVSAFVKVNNILRKLYFLPREHWLRHGQSTDEEVDMQDVYEEVAQLMTKLRVDTHKMKSCPRKYAFELSDVPREAEYLKLMYSYEKSALPIDVQGETFSHVFGKNTSLFEQFVLWKNIMGPCWLKLDDADFTAVNGASWCKLECQVSDPTLIAPLSDSENLDTPKLTLMSLSFRTQLNVKENKQEILVASARVYENVSLTDPSPPEKLPCKTFTVMRPSGPNYPIGFEAETKKQRGTFMLEKSEQFLLSKFLALLEKMDPDVLIGHQLQEVDLTILISRLKEKKTPGWHRIGRLKRSEWPKNFKGTGFFADRQLVSGRLICDIGNDMGKVSCTQISDHTHR